MLTPFHTNGTIDWDGVEALVDWYVNAGVSGLFAVCLSSEFFALNSTERAQLASRVVTRAGSRVPVVAAGAFGRSLAKQAEQVRRFADTGVAAVVITVNQLATQDESPADWQANAAALLDATGDIPLGLYECPVPYHRTLTPAELRWAARTGRFHFIKDTCCRGDLIKAKIRAVQGTPMRWFNAHSPTLLESLRAGGDGYSGIAANAYPELFVRLCSEFRRRPAEADRLQRFLTLADPTIRTHYPVSAKRYLHRLDLPIRPTCRIPVPPSHDDDDETRLLENLRDAVADIRRTLNLLANGAERRTRHTRSRRRITR